MDTITNTGSWTSTRPPSPGSEVARLEAKVDALTDQVAFLVERQRRMADLQDDATPIVKDMMSVASEKLTWLEERGYFQAGQGAVAILDNIVSSYEPEDFELLAQSIVKILDTVRNLTQPDVLAVADQLANVVHDADKLEPVGLVGAVKASRDDDVQRGMAILLQSLRLIGQAASKYPGAAGGAVPKGLASKLAPSKPRQQPAERVAPQRQSLRATAPTAPTPKAAPTPPPATFQSVTVPGSEFDEGGFLCDPSTWTPELARVLAMAEGIELTDRHWEALNYCRSVFQETGKSPNVRAVTKGLGMETKELYTLFPKAPGKTIARLAGCAKPGGCI